MPTKPIVALLCDGAMQKQIFDATLEADLSKTFEMRWVGGEPHAAAKLDAVEMGKLLADADAAMTCWGTPAFSPEILAKAPKLKMFAHAAGSLKHLVNDALWARNITCSSGAYELAVDVSHYVIGLMIVGFKNTFEFDTHMRAEKAWRPAGAKRTSTDIRGATIGIVAASQVGRRVLELLKNFGVTALLYDPFVSDEQAKKLGAQKVELDELLKRSDLVSIHAPSLPQTNNLVNAERLALMKDGAIFMNTSRGTLVDEKALVAELKRGRLWAFLDVTDPEPPAADSPLYTCPNLTLAPHIAGPQKRGRTYLGRCAYNEIQRFFAGEPLKGKVTKEMIDKIG